MAEPEPELQSEIMMLKDRFININPYGATIYVGIFDGKLLNFRWSEFKALNPGKGTYPETEDEAQRLKYFNSQDFKESRVFNDIKSSDDGKAVAIHGTDIFDFDIITDRGNDRERPTQYAWKMGNYCEENTLGPGSHNIGAALCGDPITGKRLDEIVGGTFSDSTCTSKIDHAVHIKESFDTRVSELKLDNYQLLDDPLYDRSPLGTHPSDHSAICFDIICTTDLMTEYYGGKFRGLETNYASFYNLERSPPEPGIEFPVPEIIDICGTLISWNAEGFCGVLPFLLLEGALRDFPAEVSSDFEKKIEEFIDKNSEVMSTEVLIKKINEFYTEMRPLLAGLPVGAAAAFFTSGILPAIGVAASGVATAAGAEKLTSSVKPGGYWIPDDWEEYIRRFNHKNCKILMIQELFLKDFLGMVEIRDHIDEIVLYIARKIITLLSGGGAEEGVWRYQWDGYTGCVFWDSSVYELVDSLSVIRNKEAVRRGPAPVQSILTELNHGGVWEHTKTKLEAGQEGDKFSTYFKFKLKVGESFLNVTNIHLKAAGVGPAPDHSGELRNILNKIKSNARSRPKDHYLIGDFNNKDIQNLIMDVSLESVFRDPRCIERWYKPTGRGAMEMMGNTMAAATAAVGDTGAMVEDAQRKMGDAAGVVGRATAAVGDAMGDALGGVGGYFGLGGGKNRKSTRRKRKSTRRKHKKTHKKSKRKSYKKKRKTKRK